MKIYLAICCLLLTGCQAFSTEESPTVIPAITVRSDNSLLRLENGTWYYRQLPFSGTIETYFKQGSLKARQTFYNGKEEGWLYTWYENGQRDTKRYYHKGEKDSISLGWWHNGHPRFEYHFLAGNYDGDFKEWYENGTQLRHIVYRNGKEERGKGWRNNGKPYMNFIVKNNRFYGVINPNLCYSLKKERGQ